MLDDDTRELLGLLVQAGKVAERLLLKSASVAAAPAVTASAVTAPVAVVEVAAAPASPSATGVVKIPEGFQVGRYNFADHAPQERTWFTAHAYQMLVERHHVSESIAYRTLQHVMGLISYGRAEFLFARDNGHVWAVHFFGRVALAVTDPTDSKLVTFLPESALENEQITHHPDVRTRLSRYIKAVQSETERHRSERPQMEAIETGPARERLSLQNKASRVIDIRG